MAKIKCPHCGAGNRDVEQTDSCWQCGKGLWEPVNRQTYALDSLPPLGETTSLSPDQVHKGPPRWQLWTAALAAILTLLIFAAVLIVYLYRATGETGGPAPAPAPVTTKG